MKNTNTKTRRDFIKLAYTVPVIILLGDVVKANTPDNPACYNENPPEFCLVS